MIPGRELDALIAERVMGLSITNADQLLFPSPGTGPRISLYSTDIAAAWQIVEKFRMAGDYKLEISAYPNEECWTIKAFHRDGFAKSCTTSAKTLPHAICLAALKAVNALP